MMEFLADHPVRDLKAELASRDARRRQVNAVLYDGSATYRQALDGILIAGGSYVTKVARGCYEIRSSGR